MKKRLLLSCPSPAFWLVALFCLFQFVWLGQSASRAFAAPANDNFAAAAAFPAAGGTVNGTNVDATQETGEPTHYFSGPLDSGYFMNAGNSVWYRWTAPSLGNASVKYAANFGPVIAVYTGNSLSTLTKQNSTYVAGSKLSWRATAGTTYYVVVDSLFYFVNGQALEVDKGPFSLDLAFAPSPANDHFANAITITGNANQTTGNNAGAYVEDSEPYHGGRDSSMWYRWTAPANGSVIFDTEGTGFDTILSAYTGTTIGGLTLVAQDNDGGTDNLSKMPFTVVAGTTYNIVVGGNGYGFDAPRGNFTLKWAFANAPANDNFAGQIALAPAAGGTVNGNNIGANSETGEPDPTYGRGRQSIWYNWTAPGNGVVTMDTTGSSFNTFLEVYTGPQVNGLTSVAYNDDDLRSAPLTHSKIKLTVAAGTLYRVRVDNAAYPNSEASIGYYETHGPIKLNWKFTAAPANDLFTGAANLAPVNGGSVVGTNVGASIETGENDPTYGRGRQSIWYKWTAPTTGVVTLNTQGSKSTIGIDFNTYLSVYTGTQVNGLTDVAYNDNDQRSDPLTFSTVKFTAAAGTTYFIRVDNSVYPSTSDSSQAYDETHGSLTLNWNFQSAPANDNFASAQALPPAGGKVQGTNVGASAEAGENDPTYGYGKSSIWYKWTAPSTGVVTMDTNGSKTTTGVDFNTYLSVYTGPQVNALSDVAYNNDDLRSAPLTFSKVKFTAVGGTTYFIRLDNAGYASSSDSSQAYDATHGTLALTWSFVGAPSNDLFANALNLAPANAGRVQGTNVGASLETGEYDPTYGYGKSSVWYKWLAPGGGSVTFSTAGSKTTTGADFNTYLSVYTGGVISALSDVTYNNDDGGLVTSAVTFTAQGGTTYLIRVDNGGYASSSDSSQIYDSTHGDISLSWTLNGAPVQAPVIASFTPASGKAGTSVTISGSGFTGATNVSFNGVKGTVTSLSAAQIVVTAPAGVTTGRITVTTPQGTAVSATDFLVAPTITSFTPTVGNTGLDVTITGNSFTGVTSVQFAGLEAAFTVNSLTQIVAKVPANAVTGKVSVTTAGGTAISTTDFSVPARIDSFTPATGPVGTRVTITGANFLKTSAVTFNGVKTATPTVTATSISVLVPAGATTGKIAVTTPAGTTTSATNFVVILPPTITSFTPATGAAGTSVTINGANFINGGTTVKFGGVAATAVTYVNAAQIRAAVPVGAITGKITVTTVAGTATSATDFVAITPVVSSFTPNKGNVGTVVTITGNNFTAGSTVKFGALAATSVTFVSATQIKATVPANALTGKVGVTTSLKTTYSTADFIVTPRITSFTPNKGPVGTVVTLTGANFIVGGTTVKVGSLAAANVTVASSTKITFSIPAGAGTSKISVTTTAGTAISTADFIVSPAITTFSPASGKIGTTVTINGSNFVNGATTVKFGTVAATTVTFVATSRVTAVVPPTALTSKISVTTAGGTATSAANFLVLPTITSFTPASGAVGTVVTIKGTSFVSGATTVKFGALAATTVTFVSSSQITAVVPAGAATGKISVTTAGGTATSTTDFVVAPSITSFTPASGKVGLPVTINGKNFVNGATTVKFGTGAATSVTFVSTSKVTAVVPANATTGKITVTTAGGTTTSATDFLVVPSITSFTPTSGKAGTVVTIDGTSFVSGGTTVKFGTGAATTVTFVSATRITAVVPANAVTGKISVTTSGGTGISSASFTLIAGLMAPSSSDTSFAAASEPSVSSVALSLTSASAATDSVSLHFLSAVDVETATDATRYVVKVNGQEVAVQIASLGVGGNIVTLGLEEGTVQAGDRVEVEYQILDGKKRLLKGTASA